MLVSELRGINLCKLGGNADNLRPIIIIGRSFFIILYIGA